MEKKREPGYKAKCKKTVRTETGKGHYFLEGEEYSQNTDPDLVYPDERNKVCLIDDQGDPHFMDWKWFHEHFTKL